MTKKSPSTETKDALYLYQKCPDFARARRLSPIDNLVDWDWIFLELKSGMKKQASTALFFDVLARCPNRNTPSLWSHVVNAYSIRIQNADDGEQVARAFSYLLESNKNKPEKEKQLSYLIVDIIESAKNTKVFPDDFYKVLSDFMSSAKKENADIFKTLSSSWLNKIKSYAGVGAENPNLEQAIKKSKLMDLAEKTRRDLLGLVYNHSGAPISVPSQYKNVEHYKNLSLAQIQSYLTGEVFQRRIPQFLKELGPSVTQLLVTAKNLEEYFKYIVSDDDVQKAKDVWSVFSTQKKSQAMSEAILFSIFSPKNRGTETLIQWCVEENILPAAKKHVSITANYYSPEKSFEKITDGFISKNRAGRRDFLEERKEKISQYAKIGYIKGASASFVKTMCLLSDLEVPPELEASPLYVLSDKEQKDLDRSPKNARSDFLKELQVLRQKDEIHQSIKPHTDGKISNTSPRKI